MIFREMWRAMPSPRRRLRGWERGDTLSVPSRQRVIYYAIPLSLRSGWLRTAWRRAHRVQTRAARRVTFAARYGRACS